MYRPPSPQEKAGGGGGCVQRLCVPVLKQDMIFKRNNLQNAPEFINVHRFRFISKYINALVYVYSSVVRLLETVTRNLNVVMRNAKVFVSGSYLVAKIIGNRHIHGLKENCL